MAKDIKAGGAVLTVSLRDKLKAGLQAAARRLRGFSTVVSRIGAGLLAASSSIAAPLTAAVKHFTSFGDQVDKIAARTSVSTEAISEMGFAAEQTGTDIGTLEKGFFGLSRSMFDLERGGAASKDAFGALGLTLADLSKMSPEDQFMKVADALSQVDDASRKGAIAQQIFGRSGRQLLPLLSQGASGIEALRDQARALGITVDADAASSAANLTDTLNMLWRSIKGGLFQIGAALAPMITDIAKRFVAVAVGVSTWIRNNRELFASVAKVVAIVAAVGVGLVALGGAGFAIAAVMSGLATIWGFVATAGGVLLSVVGAIVSPLGLLVTAVIGAGAAFLHFSGLGAKAVAFIRSHLGGMLEFVRSVFGGIASAILSGDFKRAGEIAMAGLKVAVLNGIAVIRDAWPTITHGAKQAVARIQQVLSPIIDRVQGIVSQAVAVGRAAWGGIVEGVEDAVGGISSVFGGGLELPDFLGNISTVFGKLPDAASGAFGKVRELASAAFGSVATTVQNLIAGVGTAFQSALGFVQGYFGSVVSSVGATLSGIGAGLQRVAQIGATAFQGIFDALLSGNFELAGRIAWQSLQLAFLEGKDAVTSTWHEFTTGLVSILDGVVVTIRKVWSDVTTWIAEQMLKSLDVVTAGLDQLAKIDPTGKLAEIRDAISLNVDATIEVLKEDRDRFQSGIDAAKAARDGERAAALQERLAASQKAIDDLRAARDAALAKASEEREQSGGVDNLLGEAQSDLSGLLEAAKATFQESGLGELFTSVQDAVTNLGESDGAKVGGDSLGTFSSSAAALMQSLGPSPADERTANAAEKTATNTASLLREHKKSPTMKFT